MSSIEPPTVDTTADTMIDATVGTAAYSLDRAADRVGFPLMGARAFPVVTGADTAGGCEAVELRLGAAAASPLHTVDAFKAFVVLSGQVVITVGDLDVDAVAGDVVRLPAGTPHRYRNLSGADASMLVLTSGARQVSFLRGMSQLTAGGPPDPQELARHTADHGVALL